MAYRTTRILIVSALVACGGPAERPPSPNPISVSRPVRVGPQAVTPGDPCGVPVALRTSCKLVQDRVLELWEQLGRAAYGLRDYTLGRCLAFRWSDAARACATAAPTLEALRVCAGDQTRAPQGSMEMAFAWWERPLPCPAGSELIRLPTVATCMRTSDAKEHGAHVDWSEDGSKQKEGRYEDGERTGAWTIWDKDVGCWRQTGSYLRGQRHGAWVGWHWGEARARARYDRGTLVEIEGDDYWLVDR